MEKYLLKFKEDPVWSRLLGFCLVLFFIRLSDSIIAFWAPNQIQNSLNNSVIMGAIISLQSVVGLSADLIFPKIFKSIHTRRLIFWAIIAVALASFGLTSSSYKPLIAIFIVTMALWGIYYELLSFANYQFMSSVIPSSMRAAAWGFMGIFINLAYFLGPFIATSLLSKGVHITQGTIIIFLLVAFAILTITRKKSEPTDAIDFSSANPLLELKQWFTLSKAVWPALSIGIILGIIDATFYTVGTVWTEKLSLQNPWGVWFLPLYLLPSICLGVPLSNWNIKSGKKRLAKIYLAISGIFFILIGLNSNISWQLTMVALASSAVAVCHPLLQGVYTDILARINNDKKGMIGLTGSTLNLSYIIWPVIAGTITARVGERMTFAWLGVLVLISSIILLAITPKKIKLPQSEIKTWN